MINLRGNIFGHRRETQCAGILGLLNTFASTHFERFLKPAAFLAARVLSRIWLCNVTTYKNRFLALTPTSRRSSSARSALMEVPNDEIRAALQENYDRHSPLLLPRVFFSFVYSMHFLISSRTKRAPFIMRRAEVLIPTKTRSPQKHIPLWTYIICAAVRKTHRSSHPAAAQQHCLNTQTGLPRVIWNFLPRPNARVWVPSFI